MGVFAVEGPEDGLVGHVEADANEGIASAEEAFVLVALAERAGRLPSFVHVAGNRCAAGLREKQMLLDGLRRDSLRSSPGALQSGRLGSG